MSAASLQWLRPKTGNGSPLLNPQQGRGRRRYLLLSLTMPLVNEPTAGTQAPQVLAAFTHNGTHT